MENGQTYAEDIRREELIRAVGQGDREACYRLYQDTARPLYSGRSPPLSSLRQGGAANPCRAIALSTRICSASHRLTRRGLTWCKLICAV